MCGVIPHLGFESLTLRGERNRKVALFFVFHGKADRERKGPGKREAPSIPEALFGSVFRGGRAGQGSRAAGAQKKKP